MNEFFEYKIKILDPLFYALEGISGAYTPQYLHATAINFSVTSAMSLNPEKQPYLMTDNNGGKNIPRYKNSIASELFYFTPARILGNLNYQGEIVKSDGDAFVSLGYGSSTGKAEILKASKLFFIPPETEFYGYSFKNDNLSYLPQIIRLGSFRGKAEVKYKTIEVKEYNKEAVLDHPVDPLVTDVTKGFMFNMFPYPIVDNAQTTKCFQIKGRDKFISLPVELTKINKIKGKESIAII